MLRNLSADPAPSETIKYRMKLYSVGAVAAGVSILALAQPAEAEIIVTKRKVPIIHEFPVSLDLNKDGIADFQFSLFTYRDVSRFSTRASLNMRALTRGAVIASRKEGGFVYGAYGSALIRGAKIGPSAHFSSGYGFGESYVTIEKSSGAAASRRWYGKWGGNPHNRFLGLKFKIHGATHFGWVRLTVITTPNGLLSGTITGFAYETEPNKPILTGTAEKPTAEVQVPQKMQHQIGPSLGMLAAGAEGLTAWRREEPSARQQTSPQRD
jgi:hypothetical protein